jgi:hypothetical protein
MRSRVASAGMLVLLISLASRGQTSHSGTTIPPQSGADAISLALSRGEVGRVEILRVPPNLEVRAAIKPEALEHIYYTKLEIRRIADMPWGSKMIEAFRTTSVERYDYTADLRWGVIFYSLDEVRIGAIYFDRSGRHGAINDAQASFRGSFFNWLESTFSSCP